MNYLVGLLCLEEGYKTFFEKNINHDRNIFEIVVVLFQGRKVNKIGLHLKICSWYYCFSAWETSSYRLVEDINILRFQSF